MSVSRRVGSTSGGGGATNPPGRTALPTLAEVCAAPDDFLASLDLGTLNLMCAGGLPGAENLDVPRLLDWLDEAARKVDLETRRHWYRFLESPRQYRDSPAYFCCYYLLQVLQEDFGVKYNPARVRDPSFQDPRSLEPDFTDSRDLFIHGIIDGPGGTCASMPVIYVAVGRRLGYPLKLVESRGHFFVRWDDPLGTRLGVPERINIEGTGNGIASYADDYYRTWPEPWSEVDKRGGRYLKSLSPKEELAAFLVTRGECLRDIGRIEEAIQSYQWACALAPDDARYHQLFAMRTGHVTHQLLWIENTMGLDRLHQAKRSGSLEYATGSGVATPGHRHLTAARASAGIADRPEKQRRGSARSAMRRLVHAICAARPDTAGTERRIQ